MSSLIAFGDFSVLQFTLCKISNLGCLKVIFRKSSSNRSAADRINDVWKGALTSSFSARLAPFSVATTIAASTASISPAITTCPGALKLTASTI